MFSSLVSLIIPVLCKDKRWLDPSSPVLHGNYLFLQLLCHINEFQSLLDFSPHVLHFPLHRGDGSFCPLYLGLLGIDLDTDKKNISPINPLVFALNRTGMIGDI